MQTKAQTENPAAEWTTAAVPTRIPEMPANGFQPHPFSQIWPKHSERHLVQLKDTIAEKGQCSPIVLLKHEGRAAILDGNLRQAVCISLGIKPRYRWYDPEEDGPDPLYFVYSKVFDRPLTEADREAVEKTYRTEADRQMEAAKSANMKQGDNRFTKKVDGSIGPSNGKKSLQDAAKESGTTRTNAKRAKAIETKGTPELKEAFREEIVTVSDAAAIVDETPSVQKKAVEMVKNGSATTLKNAVEAISGPSPEAMSMVVRDFEVWLGRFTAAPTGKGALRDQVAKNLRDWLPHMRTL